MAQQSFIKAVLHAQAFQNAVILSPIYPGSYANIALGSVSSGPLYGTGDGIIIGGGQAQIDGVALNACFISNAAASLPPNNAIDPPSPYVFNPYGAQYLNLNIKMIRANDYAFNIQVVLNGTPVNLTGGTLRMSAKWRVTDPDSAEVFSVYSPSNGIAFVNATAGTATVTIASDLTNVTAVPFHRIDLPYDIQFTTAAGLRYTVMYGTLTILPNVSETSP
jgi:hypothetical protein